MAKTYGHISGVQSLIASITSDERLMIEKNTHNILSPDADGPYQRRATKLVISALNISSALIQENINCFGLPAFVLPVF